jgi:hypothetical protein
LPSIADIVLHRREPPQWARTGPLHRSKRRLLFDPFVDECADGRLDVEAGALAPLG